MFSIINGAAAAAGGGHISDLTSGVVMLVAGLIFFFALDLVYLLTGLNKGYKRPALDVFRVLGIVLLVIAIFTLINLVVR